MHQSQGVSLDIPSRNQLEGGIKVMHDRGIKLILDIVCNHSSPEINGSKGVVMDDGKPLADFNDDKNNFYYHYNE